MVKTHGKIERRDDGTTDWNGRKIVRLDCRDQHGRDFHVYVPAGDQLAAAQVGDPITIQVK